MQISLLCVIGISSTLKKALLENKLLPHQPAAKAPPMWAGGLLLCHPAQSNPCYILGRTADGTTDGIALVGSISPSFSHLQMSWPASLTAQAFPEAHTEMLTLPVDKSCYMPLKTLLR